VEENKASKMFLIVAVVLGVLATIMAFTLFRENALPAENQPVKVVVAKRDLPAHRPLDPANDLKTEEIPRKFAAFSDRVVTPDQMANCRGQKLDRAVRAGQPIFLSDFALGEDVDIKEPYRLITIPANPGLIVCGDWIKIGNSDGLMVGGGPFRVVAVGGMIKRPRNAPTIRLAENDRSAPKTVSLEVSEAQALELFKGISTSPDKNFLVLCPTPPGAATQSDANR